MESDIKPIRFSKIFLIGRTAPAHSNLNVDSSWKSFVCQLDTNNRVEWYNMRGSSGLWSVVSDVLERPDGSIWTVGYEAPPQGQTTKWLTKYTIAKDTVGPSVVENEALDILYPNPASEKVTLKNLGLTTGPVDVALFDESGKIAMHNTAHFSPESDLVLALPGLNRGVYTISIRDAKKVVTRRVVVR